MINKIKINLQQILRRNQEQSVAEKQKMLNRYFFLNLIEYVHHQSVYSLKILISVWDNELFRASVEIL